MESRIPSTLVLGLTMFLVALPFSQGLAGEAEKKEPASSAEEKKAEPPPEKPAAGKAAGLVGTIVAVVPESRTLVVDIPLGKETLRLGAEITKRTKIAVAGKKAAFNQLKEGAHVRINFRRVATGDKALSVDVPHGMTS